jgi:hypothetical protein
MEGRTLPTKQPGTPNTLVCLTTFTQALDMHVVCCTLNLTDTNDVELLKYIEVHGNKLGPKRYKENTELG